MAATPVPAIAFSTPLTSDHGRHFSLGELRGKWVWLYFGYTNCPDLCPLTLSHLAGAYRALAHPEQVQVVFVSIDPGRDTPDHLAEYAGYFHPSFWGATSGEGAIDPLAHALGVKYRVNPDNQLGDYEVSHSNQVYLIDPAGGLAAAVTVKTPDDALKLAQDLNTAAAKPKLLGRPFQNLSGDSGRLCSTDPALQALMDHQQTSGSGTSVLPLATPMRMWSFASRDWLWMLGGDAILGFNDQMGPRGARANSAENWEMAMASRYVGKDILDLRLMTSLERWVLPALGTAQLFQTGESYNFNPIVDHQHPHAPVMELAGRYTAELADRSELFLYGGLVGDPALGPRPTCTARRPPTITGRLSVTTCRTARTNRRASSRSAGERGTSRSRRRASMPGRTTRPPGCRIGALWTPGRPDSATSRAATGRPSGLTATSPLPRSCTRGTSSG